jgi:hypothetical protein
VHYLTHGDPFGFARRVREIYCARRADAIAAAMY